MSDHFSQPFSYDTIAADIIAADIIVAEIIAADIIAAMTRRKSDCTDRIRYWER